MTYSYACERCGASISTTLKRRYRVFKSDHRGTFTPCPMGKTVASTLARPALAKHLNKTKYKGYEALKSIGL